MNQLYSALSNIRKLPAFFILLFSLAFQVNAQQATVSIPVGIGRPCGGSAAMDSLKYFNYNSTTNQLSSRSDCLPNLAAPGFSSRLATVSFNPFDGYLYFSQIKKVGAVYNTYTFRWLPTVCPSLPAPALPVYQTFPNQFVAGVEFDAATGLGYQVNFVGAGPYTMELQQVNFATGVLGPSIPVNFGTRLIYAQNGDVVMTPGGQFLGVYDNKYFTINWKDYGVLPLVATYIDTLGFGAGNNLVGLSYSGGKLVGSIEGGTCSYKELDILTGAQSPVTYSGGGTLFTSTDMTNIPSGLGAAKKLVSATENPLGSQIYDIVYDVVIKNYGGTPVFNVQAFDTLNNINGAGNAISGSITSFSAPPGITQNATYNGRTSPNFSLLTPGSTLSNIPGKNTITLRITCRIANIKPGIIYNNQATVTGTGLLGDALSDLSTNGSNPDLNSNDKPDDAGEGQPTPLLIAIIPQTPPCSILTNVMYTQTFGAGIGLVSALGAPVAGPGVFFATASTGYAGNNIQPIPTETYTVTNNANNANTAQFLSLTDRTGNVNGRMLIVNADAAPTVIYRATFLTSTCAAQQYSLSFYAAFIGNPAYQTVCNAFGGFQYPRIKMRVSDGVTGLIIAEVSTSFINNTTWQQYGFKFLSPASYNSLIIELFNDAPGGCGNDMAIDDIQYGTCDALPVININPASAGCLGSATTFTSSLSDPSALPGTKDYQWQISTDNITWVNIGGANAATYTINPVTVANTGKYYRVMVAATGNIGNTNCRYISPSTLLTAKNPSIDATSAQATKNNFCPGKSAILSLTGGTLGTNASWKWYSGSCGSTLVGTGNSISVSPVVSTTYYVRAEGDCNNSGCVQVTILIACDIDKDKDGIPDVVESNMPLALQDVNGNGIINAYDITYPGFVDNNGDFINDNFQADGDSDGDGILNYLDIDFPGRIDSNGDGVDDRFDADLDGKINMLDLDSDNDGIPDVVEAGGADANGDGKIDNFSDTDGDGLSQNADANNTGAYNSGMGLGAVDDDGDGVLNEFDLDSDNDGIPDVVEVGGADVDKNGKLDGFVDVNGDGLSDNAINATALLKTGADVNNDGRADSYPFKNMDNDKRANPYDIDSDGDGIVDVIEAGFPDANFDGFIDGARSADGWNTAKHGAALNLRNTDGRGNPDYLDIDSDDDGIPDNIEGQSTAGYKFPSYADSDNDGLDNAYDLAPFAASFGGTGIFVYDHDGDAIPDYRDLDTDSDGVPDIVEGNDFNRNGIADDNVTLTFLDTDGDGLDNRFDSLNSVIDIRGTSYNMGTGGSTAGDAMPGSRSPVQQTLAIQPDRDWRYAGYLLNVQLLGFSATTINNNSVYLNWRIITTQSLNRFEIERSTDNRTFVKVGTVTEAVSLNEAQSFSLNDDIGSLNNEVIFYRLKIIATNGQIKYSNVLLVRKSNTNQAKPTLQPNPAADYTSIHFYTAKDNDATVRLIDNLGKTVLIQKQKISKGNNSVLLAGLARFSDGAYSVQIILQDEVITQKLIIHNR
ncbi:MAG: T9SS type A sorting domain-containing protein [Ferruginibacter sp.]